MQNLRSLLSTPGNRGDLIQKACRSAADALIIDLEDSVPASQREVGRRLIATLLDDQQAPMPVYVRVNDPHEVALLEDLDAIVGPGLAGVQIPKVNEPSDILMASERIGQLEADRGLAPGSIEIIVSVETARAVVWAYQILVSDPRIASVLVGVAENGDLQRELGCQYLVDESNFDYLRASVLVAARAAGVLHPIDGVFTALGSEERFRQSATRARDHGYRGKKVIHPEQIPWANEIFSPSEDELTFHRRVLAELEAAAESGRGTTTVDGLMVDEAMAENARQALRLTGTG